MNKPTAAASNAGTQSPDQAVQATLERIETSWNQWLRALDGIPAERMADAGPAGDWSIKDLLGHVAYWDQQAVLAAQHRAAGEAPTEVDWQAMNEREAAARRERSTSELWDEMIHTHQTVLETLQGAPGLDADTAIDVCGCLSGDTHEHYDEHTAEITAWRQRVGL